VLFFVGFNSKVKNSYITKLHCSQPAMFIKKYFEEFELLSSRQTKERSITADDIDFHAKESGDFFPHHMDEEWCKTQPFKKRIAHGTLIFTIAIGLTADFVNEVSMSYGYDKIRFIKPVFIGDSIYVKASIKEKREYKKSGFGILVELVETFNQHHELILVCEHIYLVEKNAA
jgi:acyl dehydratase